jgi:hypothetical protein
VILLPSTTVCVGTAGAPCAGAAAASPGEVYRVTDGGSGDMKSGPTIQPATAMLSVLAMMGAHE